MNTIQVAFILSVVTQTVLFTHSKEHKSNDDSKDTKHKQPHNVTNITQNGAIEYCNINPLQWDFEPLSSHDISRIKTLHQVHILARHGTRIIPKSISSFFPNYESSIGDKFECNWQTVNTRYYKNEKDWMSFKLHFVNNEQIVEGNCAVSSSLKEVIPQHRTNAQMAKRFFIGENDYQLMTQSQLNDISGQLTYYNQLHENVDLPEIKIIASNYERTITSATVFMSEFLNINTPEVAMELFTHDYQSDPYTSNKDKNCPKIAKYINDKGMESKQYQKIIQSDLMKEVNKDWYAATGQNYSYDAGESAVLMYCGGLNVPMSFKQFLNVLNMSYAIRESLLSNNETSIETCKLAASPMAWLFKHLIQNHILYLRQKATYQSQGENSEEIKSHYENVKGSTENEYYLQAEQAKLIYHSVHDTSILFMLEAMNISNGREPMFAEMLTLEIYERSESDPWYNKNIDEVTNELYANYLFRWTRKGKALAPFPGCEDEYDYTQSSLCSLSVLMKVLDYGQNIKPWEKTCVNVTESYFNEKDKKKKKKKKDKKCKDDDVLMTSETIKGDNSGSFMTYLWTFVFGISIGVGLMILINKYNHWFNNEQEWKYDTIL